MTADAVESPDGGMPPPRAELLDALPADAWAIVLRHARAALHELDDALLTPRLVQLRAAPTGRLAGGRARRDLARALAAGGPLWRGTAEGLVADADAEAVRQLLTDPSSAPSPVPPPAPPAIDGEEEIVRLRERLRQLRGERDAVERRATGLEARLRTERDRGEGLADELERLRSELSELRTRLDEIETSHAQDLERLRRQHAAELAEAREELREYRRLEQERELRRRREDAARTAADERAAREIAEFQAAERAARSAARFAEPGRPSRLPPGILPGTVEAASALLAPGRQLLVDGYNVSRQHLSHVALDQQRLWLVRLLEGLAARADVHPLVVFDGDPTAAPPAPPTRRVRVRFTAGGTADDELVAFAGAAPPDEPLVAVTDDRELTERLRALGVDVIGTHQLLAVAR